MPRPALKTNPGLRAALIALALAAPLSISRGQSVTVGTPPAGCYTVQLKGASDNYVALPLLREPVATGRITGVQATRIVVAGAGWSADAYARNEANPRGACYAEFLSGPLKGVFYQIVNNSADTLVLDTEGDDLTSHPAGALGFGDLVRIRPAWTMSGVFGASDADVILDPQFSPLAQADSVLLPNNELTGVNKAPNREYAYVRGVGWRRSGNSHLDVAGQPFALGEPLVVRRRAAQDLTLLLVGAPLMDDASIYIPGGNGTTANDTYTTLLHPMPATLDESGLHNPADPNNSVIRASASALAPGDMLLTWSEGTGYNRAPDQAFFYLRNAGWRRVGSASTTVGSDFQLLPERAYIVRKDKANAGVDWPQTPHP